jgi:hypothetical protein
MRLRARPGNVKVMYTCMFLCMYMYIYICMYTCNMAYALKMRDRQTDRYVDLSQKGIFLDRHGHPAGTCTTNSSHTVSEMLECFAFELARQKERNAILPFKVRRLGKISHKMQTSANGKIASLCFLPANSNAKHFTFVIAEPNENSTDVITCDSF